MSAIHLRLFHLFAIFIGYTGIICLSACTGLKYIDSADPLLKESAIKYHSKLESANSQDVKYEIADVNIPKPNGKFLWMRPALSIYNFMGTPKKEKGIKQWIKKKLGRPPVRQSDVDPENVSAVMENRLFNYGYFNPSVTFTKEQKKKLLEITYHIDPGVNYKFGSVAFPDKSKKVTAEISETEPGTLIQAGAPYQLNVLKDELQRIERKMKDSGYYYFDKNNLKFRADTASGDHRVKLALFLKPDYPPNAGEVMNIGNIVIHDDYSLDNYQADTVISNGITYLSNGLKTRPEIVLNEIQLRKGEPYSRLLHIRSLNHLTSLSIYKFVNTNFIRDSSNNVLDVHYFLTPQKKNSLSAEINTVAKTNNFVGPGISLNWRNRNLFRGAEMLTINLTGSFEVQIGVDSINTSLEFGLDAGLEIPRLVPFKFRKLYPEFIPVTQMKVGTNYYRRVELYTLTSFYTLFGYRWKQSRLINHNLRLIDVSFNKVTDQTDAFREFLEANPIVKRSFEEQFIIGTGYDFFYDNRVKERKNSFFVNVSLESAGNLVTGLFNVFNGKEEEADNQHKLFGVPFSQYFKTRIETRHYFNINRNSQLVTRGVIGAGLPYGNSDVIPYIRQFFAGGTNDIRAFVSRTVGPGSYVPPVANLGVDQTGDIKLGANIEYRFSFTRIMKGAVFMDAGNVWLRYDDPERPGGYFELNRFYKEIALGSGIGLRFDADFVVLRIDVAWPLYKPNLPVGDRWVIDTWNPLNSSWRRENLLLNIAIGYPF
jgi:outer membrane protein assembly factor BamA